MPQLYYFAVLLLHSVALISSALMQVPQSKDTSDYYRKWLNEDVAYIITPAESAVFTKLQTAEEKDAFIEQFWLRRDPTNNFKEEHYRRLAYANARFRSGKPGWKTDRGMIYIKFGPPSNIDAHPAGGTYQRTANEGGGFTSTYPFEVWTYRHIEGIGENVEIEFVDPSVTGEYRIARDENEKDALLNVPGIGFTQQEETLANLNNSAPDKRDRIYNREPELRSYYSMKDLPMERLQTIYKLQGVPAEQFKQFETLVTARVQYYQIPILAELDVFRLSSEVGLVPLTLQIKNSDLQFKKVNSIFQGEVNVYGRLTTLAGSIVYEFEETLTSSSDESDIDRHLQASSTFQKTLPLRPGIYKVTLVVKDLNSEKLSTMEKGLVIPKWPENTLTCSSMVLSRRLFPAGEDLGEPFVFSGFKIYPDSRKVFSPSLKFFRVFFETYGLMTDQATGKADVDVSYTLENERGLVTPSPFPVGSASTFVKDKLVVYNFVDITHLEDGKYKIHYRVKDRIANRQAESSTTFEIKANQ